MQLIQVADAITYLHSDDANGVVVHGDIKGDNILISKDGHALLGDFGLSRIAREYAQHTSALLAGSVSFRAPELLFGEISWKTTSTDVYAYGMLMYQARRQARLN